MPGGLDGALAGLSQKSLGLAKVPFRAASLEQAITMLKSIFLEAFLLCEFLFSGAHLVCVDRARLRTHKLIPESGRVVIQGLRRETIDGSRFFLA